MATAKQRFNRLRMMRLGGVRTIKTRLGRAHNKLMTLAQATGSAKRR